MENNNEKIKSPDRKAGKHGAQVQVHPLKYI